MKISAGIQWRGWASIPLAGLVLALGTLGLRGDEKAPQDPKPQAPDARVTITPRAPKAAAAERMRSSSVAMMTLDR